MPAVFEVDPRSVALDEMVRFTTDVSRRTAAADPAVSYNYTSSLTQLSRELFASSEGALIDQLIYVHVRAHPRQHAQDVVALLPPGQRTGLQPDGRK